MSVKLAPSILSADFARLGEQVIAADQAGADYIHIDVMDGCFVPNITVGATVVKALRNWTKLPLDVHLMVREPLGHIPQFIEAGADIITVHAEACGHLHRTLQRIREGNARAGVALNPATPVAFLEEVLPLIDMVVVMTVNPGFGGQPFLVEMVDKIRRARLLLDAKGHTAELEVDGGITAVTAPQVVGAGARVLVAGAAVFAAAEGIDKALQRIRASAQSVREDY